MDTAKAFMTDQDNIKDYHVLLKYDITSEVEVVADLRDFEWLPFCSQQEVILSLAAKNYEVIESYKYDKEF